MDRSGSGSGERILLENAPSASGFFGDEDLDLQELVGMLDFSPSSIMGQGFDELLLPPPSKNEEDFFRTELRSDTDSGTRMLNHLPSSTVQQPCGDMSLDLSDGAGGEEGAGRRRRRIRNAKQQELNRLAQQRYRQRKKQKFGDLQATVDELAASMEVITRLEGEAEQLKRQKQEAQAKLLEQQKLVDDQKRRLDSLPAIMMRVVAGAAKLAGRQPFAPGVSARAPESPAADAATPLLSLRLQPGQQACGLSVLKAAQGQAPEPALSSAASTLGAGASSLPNLVLQQQQGALSERLLSALRTALSDVCVEQGWHESSAAQEQVLARFGKSLSKELSTAALQASASHVPVEDAIFSLSAVAPSPLMPVPGSASQPKTCALVTCC